MIGWLITSYDKSPGKFLKVVKVEKKWEVTDFEAVKGTLPEDKKG